MKRFRHTTKEDSLTPDEPTLDISSLIDVCFLLLIYFLVTTTIQPREQDLSTSIPRPQDDSLVTFPPMLIELRQGGEVVVNPGDAAEVYETDTSSRELPELRNRLQSLAGLGKQNIPKVLLKVHNEAVQQRYIDVINCLAAAGISDIALAD
ncbi:MAG: ExbD/TolR family protein [Akkermansiaceae bacterium]